MIALLEAGSGVPRWVLGGKHNQFTDLSEGNATSFLHQYNARFVKGNEKQLTFFDNHALEAGACNGSNCSRGVVLELNYEDMTVKLLHEYYHPQGISSDAGGSIQSLQHGNVLVGWGTGPAFTEHTTNGTIVMDVQLGALPYTPENKDDESDIPVYRAWKMD